MNNPTITPSALAVNKPDSEKIAQAIRVVKDESATPEDRARARALLLVWLW